jgi:N6-adenosine-specific RNA methylase IME4
MSLPEGKYRCIVADPPWPHELTGSFRRRENRATALPYDTMSLQDIAALPVASLAESDAHLWLWTTNRMLSDSFAIMKAWGFTYLTTITWVKPSGLGAWFANTTQHCLFGYFEKCVFPLERYKPTHFEAVVKAGEHSRKPDVFYRLVRSISPAPRIDLFNRRDIYEFDGWGDETTHRKQGVLGL